MRWKPVGRDAALIYFADAISDDSLRWSLAIASELERNPPPGLKDFIPAYTSVLLQFDAPIDGKIPALVSRFEKLRVPELPDRPIKEIPVTYDGVDLPNLAAHTGLPVSEVIALHTAPVYRVHLLGFTPGFPYLAGLDPRLHTPRLAKPRLNVSAGSVGIGGAQTGIYTVDGPGGWNILGHTATRIYDPQQSEPFLLRPGDRVKLYEFNSHP